MPCVMLYPTFLQPPTLIQCATFNMIEPGLGRTVIL